MRREINKKAVIAQAANRGSFLLPGARVLAVLLLSGFTIAFSASRAPAARETEPSALQVEKIGKTLQVTALVPEGIDEVELHLISSRNQNISRDTDVSPRDPKRSQKVQDRITYEREIWYPVVDLELEPGMEAVALFEDEVKGKAIINGPFHRKRPLLESELIIPAGDLEVWENVIVVEPAEAALRGFYLRQRLPVVFRKVEHRFSLLSGSWNGSVELYALTAEGTRKLATHTVTEPSPSGPGPIRGQGLERERLINALRATIAFTFRCQIRDPRSPANGGLFLFYDLDAAMYRNPIWMWGWGPSIRMLLDAAELPEPGLDPACLRNKAEEIGRASMRFQYFNKEHPLHEVRIGRWGQRIKDPDVHYAAITVADNHFLSGWAWIPLYELTGDEYFLEAAQNLCRATEELMEIFPIIPHSYLADSGKWYEFTINETGFGAEGFAEIYRLTGDRRYRETGRRYIEQHLKFFQREDGLWEREYNLSKGEASPTQCHTRGQGWAMEGLLASDRLIPEGKYLDLASRMAEQLMKWQDSSGCWSFYFNRPVEEVGISEKGTALWSYLFYRLYAATGDQRHLETARKALAWCLENQYTGPDPEAYGSLVGCSPQSAVIYRKWFNVSCLYTSGFFGLAVIEELKLAQK